ncbi:MAG: hypothetical protein JWM81_684 [Candidatus Saccharibacteria bacterium]|nr:hypothetical protein [Candidatus Saccharibacteria bacterium]
MTTATQPDAYIPGVCNINHQEVAKRRRLGYIGTAAFIVLLALLLAIGANRYIRLVLFFPASLAISGFLQARNKFCVGFAAAGQQNAAEGSEQASAITDSAALAFDKARARKMNLQTALYAVIVTLLTLVIPVQN